MEENNQKEMESIDILMGELEMKNNNPAEFAAIYARKSTLMESHSIDSQIALAKDVAKENNLLIYEIYSDKESATKYHPMHREGFKKLMGDALNGKFKTVIVFRRDRLARRVEDLLEIKNLFKKNDIKIIYSNPGEYQPDDSYLSSFIENIIMAVDELEPSILAQRIAAGKRKKKERGEYVCGGNGTFGYDRTIFDSKRYYGKNEDSEDVKKVFELFLAFDEVKSDFTKLISEINSVTKIKFDKNELLKIIQKPVYGGLIFVEDDENNITSIRDTIEKDKESNEYFVNLKYFRPCKNADKIISEKEWKDAFLKYNRIIPHRKTQPKEKKNYLFKGLLKCQKCCKQMYQHKNGKYYRCTKGCTKIPKTQLIDTLLEDILRYLVSEENIESYYEIKLKEYNKNISEVQVEIDKSRNEQTSLLLNAIKNYPTKQNDVREDNELHKKINKEKELKLKITAEKERIGELGVTVVRLKEIMKIPDISILVNMLKRNVDIAQQILTELLEEVYINDKGEYTTDFRFKH